MKKVFRIIFLTLIIALGIFVVNLVWFKPFSINHFYAKVFLELALDDPELISGFGIPILSDMYNDQLTDNSEEFIHYQNNKIRNFLETLKSYDADSYSAEEQINIDIFKMFLEDQVAGMEFDYHNYPVNQMTGVQILLPNMLQTAHEIVDSEDAEAYIKRLNAFPEKFKHLKAGLLKRKEIGVMPPSSIIEVTIRSMRSFLESMPTQNELYSSFNTKLDSLEGLDDDAKANFLKQCKEAIEQRVYPEWQSMIELYEQWNLDSTNHDVGAWKLPNGDAYYEWEVGSYTTTELTPAEIHEIGLAEVSQLERKIRDVLDGQGYTDSTRSIGQIIRELATEKRFLYPDTEEGRSKCLADFQNIIDEIGQNLDGIFNLRPSDKVEVRPVPKFREEGSPIAYYQPPTLDGSSSGIFYVNLKNMKNIVKYGMKTLAYHEAVPGHHFQISIQNNLENVPFFRTILPFTAYAEGWGLYAERVAFEQGFYKNDPLGNLGRLQSEMFRTLRLVVDSGIHHKKWSREEAIEYMVDKSGLSRPDIVTEVERYIILPGQALAYKLGMIKILQYRQKAMDRLGEQFDISEFHDIVLSSGSVPMTILERIIDNWIAQKKAV